MSKQLTYFHILKSAPDNMCDHLEIKFYVSICKLYTFHYFYCMNVLPEGMCLLPVHKTGCCGGQKLTSIRSPGTGLTCVCETQSGPW